MKWRDGYRRIFDEFASNKNCLQSKAMNFQMNISEFQKIVGQRSLYIWGGGHFGITVLYALKRHNIHLAGIIDTYHAGNILCGFEMLSPDTVLQNIDKEIFIIIATGLFENEVAAECVKNGLQENSDFISLTVLKPYHFEIEVAGFCNLRCLTCPQGNYPEKLRGQMMDLKTYTKVLDKLLEEVPFLGDIQLYSWGEPLLNPALANIIALTNERGLSTAISSNLSLNCDLANIVKARPKWFRISVSGYGESYPIVHRGGNWPLVKKNLQALSQLRDKYSPEMYVEVNYHIYKHNQNDVAKMKELCKQLGFHLRTNYAFLDPLEVLFDYIEKKPLTRVVKTARNKLMIDIGDAIEMAQDDDSQYCLYENTVVIHSDLSVRNCAHLYDEKLNTRCDNFLKYSFSEISGLLSKRDVCRKCKKYHLHRYFNVHLNKGTDPNEFVKVN